MINTINLKNFKCFVNNKLNFKPITILTGANAVGKSSLIQSILLFRDSLKKKTIRLNETLCQEVGGFQRLMSQNPINIGDCNFSITINNNEIKYSINKDKHLNLEKNLLFKKKDIKWKIDYLKAERIGPRARYNIGDNEILADGSNAIYLMELYDDQKLTLPKILKPTTTNINKFSRCVEYWLSEIINNTQIDSKVDNERFISELFFKNDLVDKPVTPALTGFGLSYVLPIVVVGLICAMERNKIMIIENPEAHLHPAAQSRMGAFLALVANNGTQVIIETHSEHIIDGIRIKATELQKTEMCLINFFSIIDKKVNIEEIIINEIGELSNWPYGFFDQKEHDLEELFALWNKNGNH